MPINDVKVSSKNIILEVIKGNKEKSIKEYDDKINAFSTESNPAKLYFLLSQTFRNTTGQGELGIKLLKEVLTNPFFRDAETKNNANYIVFSNEDFDVMFSKSLSKEIEVKFKTSSRHCHNRNRISPYTSGLADLIEIYLMKKSFKNFKILVNYTFSKDENNPRMNMYNYIITFKKCNRKLLKDIRLMQLEANLQQIEIDDKNDKYDKKQLYAKAFLEDLTDLELFKAEGWRVSASDMKI